MMLSDNYEEEDNITRRVLCSSIHRNISYTTEVEVFRKDVKRRNILLLTATTILIITIMQLKEVSGMVVNNNSRPSVSVSTSASAFTSAHTKDVSSILSLLSTARAIHEQRSQNQQQLTSTPSFPTSSTSVFPTLSSSPSSISNANGYNSKRTSIKNWEQVLFDEDEEHEMNEENAASTPTVVVSKEIRDNVYRLQTATQSEVPDMELLLQMEAARQRAHSSAASTAAAAFIDTYADDYDATTTAMERLAMSSIPLQLPRPVLPQRQHQQQQRNPPQLKKKQSLLKKKSSSTRKKTTVSTTSNGRQDVVSKPIRIKSSNGERSMINDNQQERVSHEQEVQLAHIIQRGVKLHTLKSQFEQKHGRDITRTEWTTIAKLESPKELRRLVSDYRKAKNKLVTANMGLVHAVVRDLYSSNNYSKRTGISTEELIQEGSLGLIRAAELFDPNRGLRFSTYAYIWIKGILSNNRLDQTIALPAREKTKWNRIQKAIVDLKATSSKQTVTLQKLAKVTNLTPAQVDQVISKMTRTRNLLSLDYQYETTSRSGSETLQLGSAALMQDKNLQSDANLVERLQLRADVVAALARNLDKREARLMRLRYGLKDGKTRTIVECAEAMGISRARAHQLATGCLQKLRQADDAQSLQEYLLTIA